MCLNDGEPKNHSLLCGHLFFLIFLLLGEDDCVPYLLFGGFRIHNTYAESILGDKNGLALAEKT
jgi:hypothetical protein